MNIWTLDVSMIRLNVTERGDSTPTSSLGLLHHLYLNYKEHHDSRPGLCYSRMYTAYLEQPRSSRRSIKREPETEKREFTTDDRKPITLLEAEAETLILIQV